MEPEMVQIRLKDALAEVVRLNRTLLRAEKEIGQAQQELAKHRQFRRQLLELLIHTDKHDPK